MNENFEYLWDTSEEDLARIAGWRYLPPDDMYEMYELENDADDTGADNADENDAYEEGMKPFASDCPLRTQSFNPDCILYNFDDDQEHFYIDICCPTNNPDTNCVCTRCITTKELAAWPFLFKDIQLTAAGWEIVNALD